MNSNLENYRYICANHPAPDSSSLRKTERNLKIPSRVTLVWDTGYNHHQAQFIFTRTNALI